MIVVGIVVSFFEQLGVAGDDGFVFVRPPKITVVAPITAPAVAYEPSTIVFRAVPCNKVFF